MTSSSNKDASTVDVFSACAEKGIAEYFKSTETAAALAEWLHEETRLPTPLIKFCLKLLAQGLELSAKAGGAWLGRLAGQRIKGLILGIPGLGNGLERISEALGKLDKEAEAKQKFKKVLDGQRPADMAAFADYLSLDLQAQLKELETLEEFRDEVRAALDSIQADLRHLLNPQPHLSLHLEAEDEQYKFKFYTRWIPFLGREKEWAALESFLESDKPFSWWLATGDAGSGKSRLALEFAMEHEVGWRAGFLDTSGEIDWHTWQPERPTLLISDYAFREPEVLRNVAKALAGRKDLDCPVRLLLLERQAEGPWMDTFLGTRDWHRHAIEQTRFDEQFLALPPMAPEELRTLCLAIIAKLKVSLPPGRVQEVSRDRVEEVLELMQRMGGRPLFVAFIADALARDGDPRKWDRDVLLKDVLGREMDRWRDAGATGEDMTLLAFATMTGGLSAEDAGKAVEDAAGLLPRLDERTARVHSFMTGSPAEALKPLEPDILGEMFVLEWLSPESKLVAQAVNERTEVLRKLAWRFSLPGMSDFLTRTATDFPEHSLLAGLSAPAQENKEQRKYWVGTAINLITVIGKKQLDMVASLYEAQKSLAVEYDEPGLWALLAVGATRLIIAKAGDFKSAQVLYQELAVLASDHPDKPIFREQQSKGAVNLIAVLGQAGEIESAQTLYLELAALASDHPEESALREAQAFGVNNLLIFLTNAGDFKSAQTHYQEFAVLASDHPGEPALREVQAKCAVNCIIAFRKSDSLKEADSIYQGLVVLAWNHPAEFNLIKCRLQGGLNLIQVHIQANQLDAARRRQEELLRVCESIPGIPQETVDQLQNMVPAE